MTKKIPGSEESLEFKTQIVKAPRGWSQWYVVPKSKTSIKITWARPKRKGKK